MRRAILLLTVVLSVESEFASAQDKTADQGIYTSAQAARGSKVFDAHCVSCHREGGTAPVLAGERFTKSFADATLLAVFTTIQTTMPRQAPGSLTEAEYVDAVAHLLRLNGYPDGMTELAVAGLGDIKIPGQGGEPRVHAGTRRGLPGASGPGVDARQSDRPGPDPRTRTSHRRRGHSTRSGAARRALLQTPAGVRGSIRLDRAKSGRKRLPDTIWHRGESECHLSENPHDCLPQLIYNFWPNP